MKKSDITYFSMLRSALWNEKEFNDDRIELGDILETAQRQTTMGLVCHVALQSKVEQTLSDAEKDFLREQLITLALMNKFLDDLIVRIVSVLRENGIEPVLLKGQGLAANYPVAELRQCGDIDLYVGKQNYDEACALVNEMAGETEAAKGFAAHEMHYHVVVDGADVEIHRLTAIFPRHDLDCIYQAYSDKGMAPGSTSVMINNVKVWLPSDTFNALYVFRHAYHHFVIYGIGMRQLCDWTMLLHAKRETIDRDELSDMLHRLQLMDAWQVFGCIAVDWLGLPKEEMPFYDGRCSARAKRVVGLVLEDGNFGCGRNLTESFSGQSKLKRRLAFFHITLARYCRLFLVFPKAALLQYSKIWEGYMRSLFGKSK